jgi:hypothetical protein
MKRIVITEDERQRILDMHKSAILSEQTGTAAPTPAGSTAGLMSGIRQDQRQARQDLRAQQKDVRQDIRQAKQDIRQDARQQRQDARQDARAERQAQRQENQAERQAQRELARTQRQAERAAKKEARQEKRDMKQLQSEIADLQKVMGVLQQADKSRKEVNPQDNTYTQLITTYQTAITNLQANLQSMGSGQQQGQYQDDSFKTN